MRERRPAAEPQQERVRRAVGHAGQQHPRAIDRIPPGHRLDRLAADRSASTSPPPMIDHVRSCAVGDSTSTFRAARLAEPAPQKVSPVPGAAVERHDQRHGRPSIPRLRHVEREAAARLALVVGVQHAHVDVVVAERARAQPRHQVVVPAAGADRETTDSPDRRPAPADRASPARGRSGVPRGRDRWDRRTRARPRRSRSPCRACGDPRRGAARA